MDAMSMLSVVTLETGLHQVSLEFILAVLAAPRKEADLLGVKMNRIPEDSVMTPKASRQEASVTLPAEASK